MLPEEFVRAWYAPRMADYKLSAGECIGSQALPSNVNGKIQKAELCEMALCLP